MPELSVEPQASVWRKARAYFPADFWNSLLNGAVGSLVATALVAWNWQAGLLVAFCYVLALLYLVNRRRRKRLEALLYRRASYDLARTTLQQMAKLLKSKLRACSSQAELISRIPQHDCTARLSALRQAMVAEEYDEKRGRLKLIHQVLDIMCEQFSRDTFGKELLGSSAEDGMDGWPQDFFKATYYERRTNSLGHEVLERIAYVYPPGLTPNDKSQTRPLNPEDAGVAYFVIQRCEMRVLEDIRDEKERKEKGWVDYYSGQPERYRSMVVAPVVQDLGVAGHHGVAVVTIDTGRPRYFRDDVAYKAFLSDLITPYLALLALLWQSERYHDVLFEFAAV